MRAVRGAAGIILSESLPDSTLTSFQHIRTQGFAFAYLRHAATSRIIRVCQSSWKAHGSTPRRIFLESYEFVIPEGHLTLIYVSNQQLSTLQWRIPLPVPVHRGLCQDSHSKFAFMARPVFGQQGSKYFVWLHRETERKATPRKETLKFGHLSNPTSLVHLTTPCGSQHPGPYEGVGFIKPSWQRLTPARYLASYASRCLLSVHLYWTSTQEEKWQQPHA